VWTQASDLRRAKTLQLPAIELGNIHVKWKLPIENIYMLLANENVTVWIGTWFGVYGCVTNKGEINYMGGTGVAKLIWMEMETVTPIITRTDLGTFTGPTLLPDSS
jgi:hypothetical protein